ncbi:MAG TPA: acetoacetate decarboxylase [Rhodocyclaceae bacterium]|nr:acetoacetate decarboxylase [Rhodocyclaceae bacterium]
MNVTDVKAKAFAMPLTSPAFPPGPYRFVNREFLVITYETDIDALRAVVPEPLQITDPLVKYEFIRMPDSTGFGDYTESGQVIPVTFDSARGSYVHSMYLDDHPPIAGGRELWGFPKKLAQPKLHVDIDTLIGTLDYGPIRIATATMGFKHREASHDSVLAALAQPNFLLKIIPHVDGSPRICELVRYYTTDVTLKGAWIGPSSLKLDPHALAPVSDLPVRRIVSALHFVADLTLGLGEVVYDYLDARS